MTVDRRTLLRSLAAGAFVSLGSHLPADEGDIITGFSAADSATLRHLVTQFMSQYGIPGLSLAVTRHGRLVLAEGFGLADQDSNEAVMAESLFRVASVSKPITSVTIMRLVESKELSLDHRPFAEDGLLRSFYSTGSIRRKEHRQRIEAITIQHLLEHSAGGWGNKTKDPMFDRRAIDLNHRRLIVWTLANHPLERDPGEDYDYSNFGYCLLARVIEAITGDDYESHVRQDVLEPVGANRTRLAMAERRARLPGEVVYYGQDEDPYHKVMRVRRMDGHGGWVSSAVDLVRLLLHVDLFDTKTDILKAATLREMTTPSAVNDNYAKGWSVNKHDNWWHMGSFNGGMSIIVRAANGHCWSMLMNTRDRSKDCRRDLDNLPWTILKQIQKWPQHDLFETIG